MHNSEIFNEVRCRFFDFISFLSSDKRELIPLGLRTILTYIPPIYIHMYLLEAVAIINKSSTFYLDINFWKFSVLTAAFGILIWIGAAMKKKNEYDQANMARLTDCVEYMFQDLNLIDYDSTLRCTIWSPTKSLLIKKPVYKRYFKQITPYLPLLRGGVGFVENGCKGRIRKFYKARSENEGDPVGAVGHCIERFITPNVRQNINEIFNDCIGNGNANDYLKSLYNYSGAEIKRLTPNRDSFLSIIIPNNYLDSEISKRDILAVLYFDSEQNRFFDNSMIDGIIKFIPRLGNILKSNL